MRALPRRGRAALLVVSLIVTACAAPASADAPATPRDVGRSVRIELSEFAFSPPQLILRAGETVTLSLINVGTLEHELMAGTGATVGMGYRSDWLAKANAKGAEIGAGDHMGFSVRVPPGATAKLVLVVPAKNAQIEIGCFVEGHYEGGMRGLIIVVGAVEASGAIGGSGNEPPTETAPPDGMEVH